MRCAAVSTLMMAALIGEVVAGPAHMHLHRRAHRKRFDFSSEEFKQSVDWEKVDYSSVDWAHVLNGNKVPDKGGAEPAAAAAAAPVATAPPSAADAVSNSGILSDATQAAKDALKDLGSTAVDAAKDALKNLGGSDATEDDAKLSVIGVSNGRTTFGLPSKSSGPLGDYHVSNVGIPYGSNIIKIHDNAKVEGCTNTFINTSGKEMEINIWNKAGIDDKIFSGSSLAPKQTTLTFRLKPDQSQTVAFMADTSAGWTQVCEERTAAGAYASVWGEIQCLSATGSGYDYSAIQSKGSNDYDMTITNDKNQCVSSKDQNLWLTDTKNVGEQDGSCYVPLPAMHLTTRMGGVISKPKKD